MISPETIALVKERTDLVALVGETVRLTRRGRSFTGLCPFHKEKTPSFHVNPERGFFHCFGCKESGSAVDFVMKNDGLSFVEAVRMLAERAGVEVAETQTDAERREANAVRKTKDDLYAVNNLAATFFEDRLRGHLMGGGAHPLARYAHEELARRGLPLPQDGDALSPIADTLQAFRVGYAPYGWDGLATFFKQQGISPVVAERVGLLVPRSSGSGYYDRFRHRLMFAVTDVTGRVIAFSGRALPEPKPEELTAIGLSAPSSSGDGQAPAKYMNSPESPIYTKGEHLFGLHQARHAIRQEGQAILVEGNFDVVSLHARGIANVVAPLGTAFTTPQAKLLKRFAPTVVVLFDGDTAGKKATRAARAPCKEGGLNAKVAVLPTGLDPDELVRRKGREAIAHLVKSAHGMLEYLITEALEGGFEGASLSEQHGRIQAVITLLREEDDPTLRDMAKLYADQLSSKLIVQGRSPTDLRQLVRLIEDATSHGRPRPMQGPPGAQTAEPPDRARSRSQIEDIGTNILGSLLDFPDLLDDPEIEAALGMLEGEMVLAVAAMRQNRDPQKGVHDAEFLAQIPRLIHSFAAGRLASPVFETIGEAKVALLDNARKLRSLSLSREKAAVVDRLSRVQAMGDEAEENALLLEALRAAREKRGMA